MQSNDRDNTTTQEVDEIKKELILYGVGSTAEFLCYYFKKAGWNIIAFTVDRSWCKQSHLLDIPVWPFEDIDTYRNPSDCQIFIAVGPTGLNQVRRKKLDEAVSKGFVPVSYVSAEAMLWDGMDISEHCKIGERTICQPFSVIEDNVMIGSQCLIGHHTRVGSDSFLASGVMTGGNVRIGEGSVIGTGAIIKNDVVIGKECIIGAGVTLLQDAPDGSVFMNVGSQKLMINSRQVPL